MPDLGAGKSEFVTPTYRAAYIGYMVDQREPSKPKLVELVEGSIREQLFRMWSELSDEVTDDTELYLEEDWGDVAVSDGDIALYVTFHDDDRTKALNELGFKDNEEQTVADP